MPWVELRERIVIPVLKYVLYRVGKRIFWLGIVGILVMVGIIVDQAWFYCGAISVAATVDHVESTCTLVESGSSISVDMDCAVARTMASNPGYRLIENRRTLLLYTAPDGTPMKEWSTISSLDGRALAPGDRLTAVIGRDDYADIRQGANIEEFVNMFAAFFGSLVVMAIGWICRVEGLIRA